LFRRNGFAGRDGFTLFEALVAVALMGLILSILATVTAQWIPNWRAGFSRLQTTELAGLALDRLTADFAAAEYIAPIGQIRTKGMTEGVWSAGQIVGLVPDGVAAVQIKTSAGQTVASDAAAPRSIALRRVSASRCRFTWATVLSPSFTTPWAHQWARTSQPADRASSGFPLIQ